MATITRTDIHRPSAPEFDPQTYDLIGVFDLHAESFDHSTRIKVVNLALSKGMSFAGAPHGSGQCSHCGAHIRYAALMCHTPTNTLMYVGEQCLDNRFSLSQDEFRRVREMAKAHTERLAKRDRIAALVDEHPMLAWLTYPDTLDNPFLYDVAAKMSRYAELSERQIAAVEKAIVRDTICRDERAAQRASATPAPSGRLVVEGTIASIRVDDNPYGCGCIVKMLVVTNAGWKVWGTMPKTLADLAADKGTRVRLTATVTPSDDDPTFAFMKRPTGASIVQ